MKKELITGIIVGLIANIIGLFLVAIILGDTYNFIEAIKIAKAQGFLTKLISMGAILNLIAFFIFIRKRKDDRARGVLIATIFIAIFTFVFKFL